jgi:amino acid adenylation domain-containing protein
VSPIQRRIYFIQRLEPRSTAYNIYHAYILNGQLDLQRIQDAFHQVIQRHGVFRAFFEQVDGDVMQAVADSTDFRLEYAEYEEGTVTKSIDDIIEENAKDFIRVYYLNQPPLIRAKLIKLKQNLHFLLIDMHHIITDGGSMEIFMGDLVKAYRGETLDEPSIEYRDYAVWLQNELNKASMEKQKEYWLNQFQGELPALDMPLDFPRPPTLDDDGDRAAVEMDAALTRQINELARESGTTLFMVLLAAYYVLLSRFTGQEDIVIGTPVENRPRVELENMVGIFLNTLALRNYPTASLTFRQFLSTVKQNVLGAFENQDYQFEELVEQLNVKRDLSRGPLFDAFFNLLNMARTSRNIEGLEFQHYRFKKPTVKYDIAIFAVEEGEIVKLTCLYRTALFEKSTAQYLMAEYLLLLKEISARPDERLDDYDLFSRDRLVSHLCLRRPFGESLFGKSSAKTFANLPEEFLQQTIVERFERQVAAYSGREAVKMGGDALTYDRLNKKANRLAHRVMELLGETNRPVALLFDYRTDIVVGMMAVLKTGRCYLPLDPEYPRERLAFMLRNSTAPLIIANRQTIPLARALCESGENAGSSIDILDIDALGPLDSATGKETANPGLHIPLDQTAYILYTSGSTGTPKGVMQTHRNVMNFIRDYTNNLHINPDDKISLLSSYCFDAARIDIFAAILNGAAVYPYDLKTEGGLQKVNRWLHDETITIYHSTPTFFRYFIDTLPEDQQFPHIRLVILGGEAVSKTEIQSFKRYFRPDCILVNNYGLTEAASAVQYMMDKETAPACGAVPIARLADALDRIYLLNKKERETAVYETGEIVYKGDCLAPGYWQLPEETQKRFVSDPLEKNKRIFRTGDLARLRPGGAIEYLGRNDAQVQVRGYRIELNEIANCLNRVPAVKTSVVIVIGDTGESHLAAYYIPTDGAALDRETIIDFLKQTLPGYMIPTYFIPIEKIPLTATGKTGLKLLPTPSGSLTPGKEYQPPGDEIEERLVHLWQDILKVEKVGIKDNFFELGGHSLRAMNLVTRIHKELSVDIPLKEIFDKPTIAQLAALVRAAREALIKIERILDEIEALTGEQVHQQLAALS